MLNNENSQNPLRAGYEELGGRTAMEAISAPSILGAAAGLPVFTGEGGTAVAKAVPEALAALGLPYEIGTWTPEKIGGTYNGGIKSYSLNQYLRIGRLLYICTQLILTTAQTTPSYMSISGFPYPVYSCATGWTVISNSGELGQGNAGNAGGNLFFLNGVPADGITIYYGIIGIKK